MKSTSNGLSKPKTIGFHMFSPRFQLQKRFGARSSERRWANGRILLTPTTRPSRIGGTCWNKAQNEPDKAQNVPQTSKTHPKTSLASGFPVPPCLTPPSTSRAATRNSAQEVGLRPADAEDLGSNIDAIPPALDDFHMICILFVVDVRPKLVRLKSNTVILRGFQSMS